MRVVLRLPLPDEQIFRYAAMDDILEITVTNPADEFSNRELQQLTGYGGPSVTKALSLLGALGLVRRRDTGGKTLYQVDETRLLEADDPLLEIPQKAFRSPLGEFVERVEAEVPSLAGVICFGSVARGEADRSSDIDVFVLVADDDDLVSVRRSVAAVKQTLEDRTFDGQRYEFEPFVESVESATNRGQELLPIFREGVGLYTTDTLDRVRRTVFRGRDG